VSLIDLRFMGSLLAFLCIGGGMGVGQSSESFFVRIGESFREGVWGVEPSML